MDVFLVFLVAYQPQPGCPTFVTNKGRIRGSGTAKFVPMLHFIAAPHGR
jgi:hypothetical protein